MLSEYEVNFKHLYVFFMLYLGPLDHTVNDFWRMVWQCDCGKIVMLTNVFEEGKVNFNCLKKTILFDKKHFVQVI